MENFRKFQVGSRTPNSRGMNSLEHLWFNLEIPIRTALQLAIYENCRNNLCKTRMRYFRLPIKIYRVDYTSGVGSFEA